MERGWRGSLLEDPSQEDGAAVREGPAVGGTWGQEAASLPLCEPESPLRQGRHGRGRMRGGLYGGPATPGRC